VLMSAGKPKPIAYVRAVIVPAGSSATYGCTFSTPSVSTIIDLFEWVAKPSSTAPWRMPPPMHVRLRGSRSVPARTGGTASALTGCIDAGVATASSNDTNAISSFGSISELKTLTAFLRRPVFVLVPPAASAMLPERSRTRATELFSRGTVVAVRVTVKSPRGYSPPAAAA
jgi:hypothetical protein